MMQPRHVFVDLPKDRRPEVYRFRPPPGEAKGGGGAFHLLGKSKLCSRKNAHRRCGILRRSKPSSTRVEVAVPTRPHQGSSRPARLRELSPKVGDGGDQAAA